MSVIILSLSMLLQFAAALFALLLIRKTDRFYAWLFLASGMLLMGIRRGVTLFNTLSGERAIDPIAESVALLISFLMLIGVWMIASVFDHLRAMQNELEDHLEVTNTAKQALLKSEQRLSLEKKRLDMALESTKSGTWDWNIETGAVYFDQNWLNILGYQENEIGEDIIAWEKLIHPDELKNIFRAYNLHIDGITQYYTAEYRIMNKDGNYQWTLNRGRVVEYNEEGKPSRMVGINTDITEHKLADDELKKMDKLNSIGILAGGIAHDFNNILTGVFGNISLAKAKTNEDEPGYKYIEYAEGALERATRLTNQLLTFSKGGAPIKNRINIGNLVEETVLFDLTGSNVKLILEKPDDLWITEVDEGQIQQVFSNLIFNATYAMPKGGHLYIEMENIVLTDSNLFHLGFGKYVKIMVRDEGNGIEPQYLNKIFDPYFSTKEMGSGLGLATSYSIINKHNGTIHVASKLGSGAVFTVYLPAAQKQQISIRHKKESSPIRLDRQSKILIMDDEEMICNFVTDALEDKVQLIDTAADGDQAIEMYQKALNSRQKYDCIIMDLTIPGAMGGKEAIAKLLEIDPDVCAVVSSGYVDDPVMANYASYGFKGIIKKPFTASSLTQLLSEVLA